jgi:hypothetical protein
LAPAGEFLPTRHRCGNIVSEEHLKRRFPFDFEIGSMNETSTGWHEDFGDEPSVEERFPVDLAPVPLPIDDDEAVNEK